MEWNDELAHTLMHLSQQQTGALYFTVFGHIADYFPDTNTVTVVLTQFGDTFGVPPTSGPIPLGTPWSGYGYGLQAAPIGGSTAADPTVGEPCLVLIIQRDTMLMAVGAMVFGGFGNTPDPLLQGGEFILKHKNGNLYKFHNSGELEITLPAPSASLQITVNGPTNINASGDVNVVSKQNVAVNATGTVSVTSGGTASVNAPAIQLGDGGTLQALMTATAAAIYNGHNHNDAEGGTTGGPNQQIGSLDLTSIVTAQ